MLERVPLSVEANWLVGMVDARAEAEKMVQREKR